MLDAEHQCSIDTEGQSSVSLPHFNNASSFLRVGSGAVFGGKLRTNDGSGASARTLNGTIPTWGLAE